VTVRHSGRSLQIIEKAPRNAASIVSYTLPDTKETDRWPSSDELRPQAQRYTLCTTREQPRNGASTISPAPRDERLRLTLSIGGMTCAACVSSITDTLSKLNGVDEPMVDLLGNSAAMFVERESLVKTVVDAVEDCGFDARTFSLEPNQTSLNDAQGVRAHDRPLRVTLSVGGMTCVACSSAITDALSTIPGVTDPVVNLLDKSATMLVEQNNLVDVVIETVTDCGFEAELFSVDPVQPASAVNHTSAPRVVSLRVDGMFSPYVWFNFMCVPTIDQFIRQCPQKVMDALKPFDSRLSVLKPLDSLVDPILRLSYHPSPPDFTIRHVTSCIASANSPRFQVSVCKPPSLEELGRQMQAREQRNILLRSIFAFIVAIPTFIIGIVFMSLLKANHPWRMFFMEPMWIGNASRAEWALFFLATPVMLYGSDIFHRRSFKEIRAMWRKGSTTPLLRRLTRFGSMNMLVRTSSPSTPSLIHPQQQVSTGVSIAYLTSILLLGFAASRPASKERSADVTTYFDSVVFLTMFLLAGRSSCIMH
jgi:P-type Cu+ transporter